MKKDDVLKLVGLDAAGAIAAVDAMYTADRSAASLEKLQILACHLNNLWPAELQEALERWVYLPLPETDENGSWRQLHCFWVSLYKRKNEIVHNHWVLTEFCNLVALYMTPGNKLVEKSQFSKDVFIDVHGSQNPKQANENLLRLAALFYYANQPDSKMRLEAYREQMRMVFTWYFYNPKLAVDPGVLAVHFVHTEGIDLLSFEDSKRLLESKHLGWLSYWHLFQVTDRVLDSLWRCKPDCTPEAKEVLEAIVELRFNR